MSSRSGDWKGFLYVLAGIAFLISQAASAHADTGANVPVYCLYNGTTGEHFYTGDENEREVLVTSLGWTDEGIGWYAPERSDVPVYRLYNPDTGFHHFTASVNERDRLSAYGWKYEGVGWYYGGRRVTAPGQKYQPAPELQYHDTMDSVEDSVAATIQAVQAENTVSCDSKMTKIHHEAVTHEEPVYETERISETHEYCNHCGADITGNAEGHIITGCADGYHCGRWTIRDVYVDKQVQTGTRTVIDQEAYDEWVTE